MRIGVVGIARGDATVLVVAHGNSLRALMRHVNPVDAAATSRLEIPTATPLMYELDDCAAPLGAPRFIA